MICISRPTLMFDKDSDRNSARHFIVVESGVAEVVFANEEVWRSWLLLRYILLVLSCSCFCESQ